MVLSQDDVMAMGSVGFERHERSCEPTPAEEKSAGITVQARFSSTVRIEA